MSASQILLVEDSDAIRLPVLTALRSQGYRAEAATDGSALEQLLDDLAPELVILDVMVPGRDGFALLDVVRGRSRAGVMMLTARDATADRVRGLTAGADDYLIKPFAMAELLARVQALLRRVSSTGASVWVGDLEVSDAASVVRRGDQVLDLTETERRLLAYLASHLGRVVSKTQLLTAVWGYGGFDENLVEVHVSGLRRKLEAAGPRLVHTVRGRGYRLAAPE